MSNPSSSMSELNRELHLTADQLTVIMRHVLISVPEEACGLLSGVGWTVHQIYTVPNIAYNSEISFHMEPKAQLNAMLEIEHQGLDLLAIYHSHPSGERTDPSETDIREFMYQGALSLIIVPSLELASASIRAFSIEGKRALEVPVVINSY